MSTLTLTPEFEQIIKSNFRVVDLKEILDLLKEKKSGNKSELISRVLENIRRDVEYFNAKKIEEKRDQIMSVLDLLVQLSKGPCQITDLVIAGESNGSGREKAIEKVEVVASQRNGLKRRREEDMDLREGVKKHRKLWVGTGRNEYGNTLRYLSDCKMRIDVPDDPFFDVVDHDPLAVLYLEKKVSFKFQQLQYQTINLQINSDDFKMIKARKVRVHARCFAIKKSSSPYIPDHVWPDEIILRINMETATVEKYDKKRCTIDLPCDISPWLHNGKNEFSVAFNSEPKNEAKKYVMIVQMVKVKTVEELFEQVKNNSMLTAEASLQRVKSSFGGDEDIVEMERKIPIFDPLSRTLIQVPGISKDCNHIQCFDLQTYIKMNERIRRWKCPVCNSKARFRTLVTDPYFESIIQENPEGLMEVTVCPDGTWKFEKDELSVEDLDDVNRATNVGEEEYIIIDISSSDD